MGAYLWEWWADCYQAHNGNGFGLTRISWPEWQAWATVRGRTLEPWEIDALLAIDQSYLSSYRAAEIANKTNI